eukprot:12914488-Prorocentrum_lima.AAC.1
MPSGEEHLEPLTWDTFEGFALVRENDRGAFRAPVFGVFSLVCFLYSRHPTEHTRLSTQVNRSRSSVMPGQVG